MDRVVKLNEPGNPIPKWNEYEERKKALPANLSTDEYDAAIKMILKELGLQ